jgi:hypothetical protein
VSAGATGSTPCYEYHFYKELTSGEFLLLYYRCDPDCEPNPAIKSGCGPFDPFIPTFFDIVWFQRIDTCGSPFPDDYFAWAYITVNTVEAFKCDNYIFDGGNPMIEWTNDFSEDWRDDSGPHPSEEDCDWVELAIYTRVPCDGSAGSDPFLAPASLTDGMYSGDIQGITGCWTITQDPSSDLDVCNVAGTLTPIEGCDDAACPVAECTPDEFGNFKYTLAYCIDPGTPVAEIITPTVYAVGTVLVDSVAGPPPRYLVIACASADGAPAGPPYEDYLMNPIFTGGITDTGAGC